MVFTTDQGSICFVVMRKREREGEEREESEGIGTWKVYSFDVMRRTPINRTKCSKVCSISALKRGVYDPMRATRKMGSDRVRRHNNLFFPGLASSRIQAVAAEQGGIRADSGKSFLLYSPLFTTRARQSRQSVAHGRCYTFVAPTNVASSRVGAAT